MMATETIQQGESGSGSSQLTGASSNALLAGTQQWSRHLVVDHKAANVAAEKIALDTHLQIVCKLTSSKNYMQQVIGWDSIHILVSSYNPMALCKQGTW